MTPTPSPSEYRRASPEGDRSPRPGGPARSDPDACGGDLARARRAAARGLIAACVVLATLATATACEPATPVPASGAALEDTLKGRIEQAYDFTRPDIVERMGALYPDSGRVISASGGHLVSESDSLRQGLADFWADVGVNMTDPRWVWGDVHVDRLGPDAAVLTGTWSIPHTAPTGRPHTIRGAWTAVFRRVEGRWLIIHEHLSVPPEGQ